jgi:hypothetical protein
MNAIIAAAKRRSFVLNAADQESGFWDFKSTSAKNAPELESALVLSATGQALFKSRYNQIDSLPTARCLRMARRAGFTSSICNASRRAPHA